MLIIAGFCAKKGIATNDDVKMYTSVAERLSSTEYAYAESTYKSHLSQVNAYLKFCLAFGHTPVIKNVGISTKVLTHYVVWMTLGGIRSLRGYISMGPRVLCQNSNARWYSISERPKLRRTIMAVERAFRIPPKRKSPITI